jgi:hypothetical protein
MFASHLRWKPVAEVAVLVVVDLIAEEDGLGGGS